jgi:peptidoglycan/xylan/chitin deacetylase (PgdA/CDA1 family)
LRFFLKKIKYIVCAFYYYAGIFHLRRIYNNLRGKRLTVLTFHIVESRKGNNSKSGLPSVAISAENFSSLSRFIKKHYRTISAQELIHNLGKGTALPFNSMLISFDDAYEEVVSTALPILQYHQMPAVLFVPTQAVDEQGQFWWDMLFILLSTATGIRFNADDGENAVAGILLDKMRSIVEMPISERDRSIYEFIETLQNSDDDVRNAVIKVIRDAYNRLENKNLRLPRALCWDEIKRLGGLNFEIGSHTVTHRFLASISLDAAREEIVESKRQLEQVVNKNILCFAYPGGKYNEKVIDLLKDAGYACAFTTEPGINSSGADSYRLKRLNMWDNIVADGNGEFSNALTAWNLSLW